MSELPLEPNDAISKNGARLVFKNWAIDPSLPPAGPYGKNEQLIAYATLMYPPGTRVTVVGINPEHTVAALRANGLDAVAGVPPKGLVGTTAPGIYLDTQAFKENPTPCPSM